MLVVQIDMSQSRQQVVKDPAHPKLHRLLTKHPFSNTLRNPRRPRLDRTLRTLDRKHNRLHRRLPHVIRIEFRADIRRQAASAVFVFSWARDLHPEREHRAGVGEFCCIDGGVGEAEGV